MVEIRWFGHSCFEISNSITVILDPHDGESLGFPAPETDADIVLISHEHDDHANGKHLFPCAKIFNDPGKLSFNGVVIKGIQAFHDDVNGTRLGLNTIWRIEVEGINIAHLGDLGHNLNSNQINELGQIDILIIGTGGDLARSFSLINQVNPKVVIPMHYHVDGIIFPYFQMNSVEDFIVNQQRVKKLGESFAIYKKDEIPLEKEIHVFSLT
jgi:L-ascorbate metabolism protein UlaG (beta-lactamase superfamily)